LSDINIIVGPPGTGKTTRLLDIVEYDLGTGIDPEDICFLAFTRKAAMEAKTRAMRKFLLTDKDLKYFRTLHSLAFMELGLTSASVMGVRDYLNIAKMLGISITIRRFQDEGSMFGMNKGDRLLFVENLARNKNMSLREYWESLIDEDIDWFELLQLHETLKKYKEVNGKIDFTDMLTLCLEREIKMRVKVGIVDEAQDLSSLQWNLIEQLFEDVEHIHIAGDDDQAIFRWAGADVDRFINLKGKVKVLDQSYRIPRKVHELSHEVISRVTNRRPKEFLHREEAEGKVEWVAAMEEIDMSVGTWYLLARNIYLLDKYIEHCMRSGYVFEAIVGSPTRSPALRAVRYWEQLRKGRRITAGQAKEIYTFMSVRDRVKHGFKQVLTAEEDDKMLCLEDLHACYGLATRDIWHIALDRLSDEERVYFLAALKNGENLLKEPRIRISTIHGVKGGEAENVVLLTDMALRTYNEYMENPEDEARVWYVGMTRCSDHLFIVAPETNNHYIEVL